MQRRARLHRRGRAQRLRPRHDPAIAVRGVANHHPSIRRVEIEDQILNGNDLEKSHPPDGVTVFVPLQSQGPSPDARVERRKSSSDKRTRYQCSHRDEARNFRSNRNSFSQRNKGCSQSHASRPWSARRSTFGTVLGGSRTAARPSKKLPIAPRTIYASSVRRVLRSLAASGLRRGRA
jgi:hypothetical protein